MMERKIKGIDVRKEFLSEADCHFREVFWREKRGGEGI